MIRKIETLIRSISVRQRLTIAFIGATLMIVLVGAIGIQGMHTSAERSARIYGVNFIAMDYLNRISTAFLTARVHVRDALLATGGGKGARATDAQKQAVEQLEQVENISAQFAGLIAGEAERMLYDRYAAELAAFKAIALKVIGAAQAGESARATDLLLNECAPAADRVRLSIEALMQRTQAAAANDNTMIMEDEQSATFWSAVLIAVSAVFAVIVGMLLSASITRPVDELARSAQALSAGRLGVRVDERGRDELAALARAFNGALGQMSDLVRRVADSARTVASAAGDSTGHAAHVSEALHRQAADAARASAQVGEIARTIDHNARQAEEAAQEASEASRDATSSSEVVLSTIDGMKRIADVVHSSSQTVVSLGARSDQIGKIVESIAGIADQTSLLALNAAIEAARAGEQGRGFAVVADEVRKLAERTQDAAREIVATVQGIQTGTTDAVSAMKRGTADVDAGRAAAEQAAGAIRGILGRTARVDTIISSVARTSLDQAREGESVAQVVAAIGTASRASLEAMDRLASTAAELDRTTHELDALVRRFDLGTGTS